MFRKPLQVALAAVVCSVCLLAHAQTISGDVVRIGVLTDMGGALSDLSGAGSVTAVRMAVEDFGGSVLGKPIEVVQGDHQNKADIASSLAREWMDRQGVDMELPRAADVRTLVAAARPARR